MRTFAQIRQEFEEWVDRREWIQSADSGSLDELEKALAPFKLLETRARILQEFVDMKRKDHVPKKSSEIFVTKAMLDATEERIMAEIRSSNLGLKSDFKDLESKFHSLEAHFHGLEASFNGFELKVLTAVEDIKKIVSDARFLKENDYSMNRSVMDGHAHLAEEIIDLRKRVEKLEEK